MAAFGDEGWKDRLESFELEDKKPSWKRVDVGESAKL